MTTRNKLMAMATIAAMLGVDGSSEVPSYSRTEEQSDFVKASNHFKQLCKPRMFWSVRQGTYVREINPDEVKGKKAIRAAKRAKVRLMKESA